MDIAFAEGKDLCWSASLVARPDRSSPTAATARPSMKLAVRLKRFFLFIRIKQLNNNFDPWESATTGTSDVIIISIRLC
jgi:hypothetical protein